MVMTATGMLHRLTLSSRRRLDSDPGIDSESVAGCGLKRSQPGLQGCFRLFNTL